MSSLTCPPLSSSTPPIVDEGGFRVTPSRASSSLVWTPADGIACNCAVGKLCTDIGKHSAPSQWISSERHSHIRRQLIERRWGLDERGRQHGVGRGNGVWSNVHPSLCRLGDDGHADRPHDEGAQGRKEEQSVDSGPLGRRGGWGRLQRGRLVGRIRSYQGKVEPTRITLGRQDCGSLCLVPSVGPTPRLPPWLSPALNAVSRSCCEFGRFPYDCEGDHARNTGA